MLAKVITRCSIANSIAFSSFLSVVVFQNAKLGFAKTLKKQKFAKISIREISKFKKFAKVSAKHHKSKNLQKLVSAKYAEVLFAKISIREN